MQKFQRISEKKFYENVGITILKTELPEMIANKENQAGLETHSTTRDARLSALLESYMTEIEENLIYLDNSKKKIRIKNYLEKANEYKKQWQSDYNNYNKPHISYWLRSAIHQQVFFINKLISKIQHLDRASTTNMLHLESIFDNRNNSFQVCMDLLEDLELTIGGQPNIKEGKMGKLSGLIAAIKETPGMLKLDKPTEKQLLEYFNSHFKSKYLACSKRNNDYSDSKDQAKRFIKLHLKK